jgi:uncharacterized protein DUF3311
MPSSRRWLAWLAVVALYALHQDVWFWRTARPLIFGFIPVGLAYHALFSIGAALLMALLVRVAWPARLEAEVEARSPVAPPPAGKAR